MVRLSTRGRYATRIMVYLAMEGNERPVPKQQVADNEGISADYVEQILMKLRTAGLVVSRRGVRGGFLIAPEGLNATVADILNATEGSLDLAPCLGERCERDTVCVTRPLWERASQALIDVFSAVTM